jgi:hypothetical protein
MPSLIPYKNRQFEPELLRGLSWAIPSVSNSLLEKSEFYRNKEKSSSSRLLDPSSRTYKEKVSFIKLNLSLREHDSTNFR